MNEYNQRRKAIIYLFCRLTQIRTTKTNTQPTPTIQSSIFLFPVSNSCADGILGEDGAVNLYGRKGQLGHDVLIRDGEGFVDGFALNPLSSKRARSDSRTTSESLKFGVHDNIVHYLDLKFHHVAALWRTDETRADIRRGLVH